MCAHTGTLRTPAQLPPATLFFAFLSCAKTSNVSTGAWQSNLSNCFFLELHKLHYSFSISCYSNTILKYIAN